MNSPIWRILLKISEIISKGFYTGYIPLIPGTFGTLPGVAIWLIIENHFAYWGLFFFLFLFSLPGIIHVIDGTGSTDPSQVVVDEILGFMVAAGFQRRDLLTGLSLFILFRIFDILKPWPASLFNRKKGVFFIFLDDFVAGIYAALVHSYILVKYIIPLLR